jgi:hypothetical protein
MTILTVSFEMLNIDQLNSGHHAEAGSCPDCVIPLIAISAWQSTIGTLSDAENQIESDLPPENKIR